MLYMDINGRPLLLPAGTTAQVEHINPLFADGIEDSYSLPVEVPVEGNREALGHVQEADLTSRTLSFTPATLGHLGMPLFPGVLHVLGSTPRVVRTTFSIDGFVSLTKGVMLPDTLRGETIDLLDELLNQSISFKIRPSFVNGGKCQFPMHRNPSLYGDANPDWDPDAPELQLTSSYEVNDLVTFTEYGTVVRKDKWQCVENAAAGQTPTTHPDKWRRAAYGVVNAWDEEANDFHLNTLDGNFYSLVPWFYLKWVITKALEHVGYKPVGEFMDDARYHEWTVANTTTIDAANTVDSDTFFRAAETTGANYDPDAGVNQYRLRAQDETTLPNQDPASLWNNSTMQFECPAEGAYRFRIQTTLNTRRPDNVRPRIVVRIHDSSGTVKAQVVTFMPRNSNTITANLDVSFSAGEVGDLFHFTVVQQQYGAAITWPQVASDHHYNTRIMGWLSVAAPTVCVPDQFIYPHRHVPNVPVLDFLMAIADAYNFTLDPSDTDRTVRMDYRQSALNTNKRVDHSHRAVNEAELDHTRAVEGVKLAWDLDTNKEDPENLLEVTEYLTEEDATPALSTGQLCVLASTRALLKSSFRNGVFIWEQVGYHVPDVLVGEADGAREVIPACKPVHMQETWLKGRKYIMPVLDAPGTSAWFHTEGERGIIWLSEFKPQKSNDGVVLNVPGARTWGYGWTYEDRTEATLLWDSADANMPGMYQRHWELWARMLTTAEPVTRDLLVDLPYLTGRSWKGLHHIHGQDYLVEKLPVEYGGHRGQLVSRGAYLLRVKYPLLVSPLEQPAFDLCPTCHLVSPEAMCIEFADLGGPATIPPFSSTGHFTVINAAGEYSTYSGTSASVPPGRYCIYPSGSDGAPAGGYFTANEFGVGFNLIGLASISGGAFNGTLVGLGFTALQMDAFVCPPVPSCGGLIIIISLCTTMDLTGVAIEDLVEFQLDGNPNVHTITLTGNFQAAYMRVILADMPALNTASMDSIANRLDATKSGEVISYNTATPTAASQANRQALYDSGNWMLPDDWMTDLVL